MVYIFGIYNNYMVYPTFPIQDMEIFFVITPTIFSSAPTPVINNDQSLTWIAPWLEKVYNE